MRSVIPRAVAGAALVCAAAAIAPAGAQACAIGMVTAQALAPAENASLVQTSNSVPVQVRFGPIGNGLSQAHYAIARLNPGTLPPLGTILPPEVGTVVESGRLIPDPATGTWSAEANGNGWAQTPGEYVWEASATETIPASPPPPPGAGTVDCDLPPVLTFDGRWVHRLTVLAASAVTAKAGDARHGRAKISGTIATTFPGRVRLTVACPGQRSRTAYVATAHGRWSRTVHARRGCRVEAAAAARPGWAASEASARVG